MVKIQNFYKNIAEYMKLKQRNEEKRTTKKNNRTDENHQKE